MTFIFQVIKGDVESFHSEQIYFIVTGEIKVVREVIVCIRYHDYGHAEILQPTKEQVRKCYTELLITNVDHSENCYMYPLGYYQTFVI